MLSSGEVKVYSRLGCCLNMVFARANWCSKQKSSSCSLASSVSPKPYSPTADDIADGSLLQTLALKSPITSSMSPLGTCLTALDKSWYNFPLSSSVAAVVGPESHKNSVAMNQSLAIASDWFISHKCSSDSISTGQV